MPKTDVAKLFQNGRSQAVRLPREFRFEGDRVRIRRVAQGVLLEPLIQNPTPVHPYTPGSWGPKEGDELVAGFGTWRGPWVLP